MKIHTDALQTLIGVSPKSFVSIVPSNTPLPYVLIHPADGADDTDRQGAPSLTQNPRFTLHSVGATYEQCAWAAEKVKAALVVNGLGVVPTVTGERSGRVWYSVPQPIQQDTDASPTYLYHTAECGFSSTPTA